MDNFFNYYRILPDGSGPYQCPAKGSNSRHLTEYQSSNKIAEKMKNENNLKNNNSFNIFVQQKGNDIRHSLNDYHMKNSFCFPNICTNNYPTSITPQQMVQQRRDYENKWKMTEKNRNCNDCTKTTYSATKKKS